MTSQSWQRLQPRMKSLLERVELYRRAGKNPYLISQRLSDSPSHVLSGDNRLLMMSSYSYLGLIGDSRIVEAARAANQEYGTGTHGVRVLAGSIPLHEQLEKKIAHLKGCEDAIVYSSGFAANVGTIAAICGPRDTIFVDKEDHASIVDGCRMSGAKCVRFRHNDMEHLAQMLKEAESDRGILLVIVDGVYSMGGDIAPLPSIRELCDHYGALLMVDEAHSLGVLGANGLGIEDHFQVANAIDIKMGTLSKAIPSVGGYVAGPADLITFLKHAARPFVFSASLPPAQVAAANEALSILEEEPWRVHKCRSLGEKLRLGLQDAGLDTGLSETPIVPLMTGNDANAFELAAQLRRQGIVANPVVAPAVPPGQARLRLTVTAAHSEEEVLWAVSEIAQTAVKVLGEPVLAQESAI